MTDKSDTCIHIHEDDWAMRSLYPVQALEQVRADIALGAQLAESSRVPNEVGWSAIHVVEQPTINYADLDLRLGIVRECLNRHMPPVKRFYATSHAGLYAHDPMGHYDENAICFGFDKTCFIKIEAMGELVKGIWYETRNADMEKLSALKAAVLDIDALQPSIIADYWLDEAGPVADTAFLALYFGMLGEER